MTRRLILMILLSVSWVWTEAKDRDSLLVMFWNVENFFDWKDQGTGESDNEFSSAGRKHWTRSRFHAKCDAIAKSIMWIGDRYGRLPDVIGLAEVENRRALGRLISYTVLRKYGYEIIHQDSGDRRGIDVALLYRKGVTRPISVTYKTLPQMSTRDILHVKMSIQERDTLDFTVNHHPSKYGGAEKSMPKRMKVMALLKELTDSLGSGRVVSMGDFNDTPDAVQFDMFSGTMNNLGLPLHKSGEGTIRYKGKWELIDFFLTGKKIDCSPMEVVRIPFLMTYEKKYPGQKPLRTYSGPRYLGGVSDHCPVVLKIY